MSKELKEHKDYVDIMSEFFQGRKFYVASDVDALIAEKDKEIESLKESHYVEMVDAGMRERRLKRALFKACANWADYKACMLAMAELPSKQWCEMERKCRAKAEKYK